MKPREPWEQRLDETDAEFKLFEWWRGEPSAQRMIPPDQALAVRLCWAERACAYDQAYELPDDPGECAREAWRELIRGSLVEVRKWSGRVLTTTEPTTELRTLLRIYELAAKMQAWSEGTPTDVSFPEGTDPVLLRAVLAARKLALTSGGR